MPTHGLVYCAEGLINLIVVVMAELLFKPCSGSFGHINACYLFNTVDRCFWQLAGHASYRRRCDETLLETLRLIFSLHFLRHQLALFYTCI